MRQSATVPLVCLLFFVSGCVVHHPGAYSAAPPPEGPAPAAYGQAPAAEPGRSDTIICEANNEMTISNRTIDVDGDGVVVSGNCAMVITNSTIIASGHALKVLDNGNVKVFNSTLQGAGSAIMIDSNGEVHAAGSTIRGPINKSSNGAFIDEGNNTME